jgi:hypothetical protein
LQGQAAAVLQHCVQQFASEGDINSRDTVMKLSCVFSIHSSCSHVVLSFALSFIASVFQQTPAPSESCSADEARELSLDILSTHLRKTSGSLQLEQLQPLLPLLMLWVQSFGPENDFVVFATQSVSELLAAIMQFTPQDVLQSCSPVIISFAQWLLQPHLPERALFFAPKFFTQVLFRLGAAADVRSIIIAMANLAVHGELPDLKYNASVFLATMLKKDTVPVMQCIKAALRGRDGRSSLSLIIEQWLNEVVLESISE